MRFVTFVVLALFTLAAPEAWAQEVHQPDALAGLGPVVVESALPCGQGHRRRLHVA